MKQGKADLAIVQQDVAEAVFSGKALYEGKPYQDFRELCYLGSRTLYFLVPRLSTLSDIRELKDCKVAVGRSWDRAWKLQFVPCCVLPI